MKYEGATGLQACVSVMVWLTFVILNNVAVVSSGIIMTPVVPKTSSFRRKWELRTLPSSLETGQKQR